MGPSETTIYQVRKDVLCSHLPDDESVLLDLDAGIYYGLNPVGTFMWHQLEQPKSLSELVQSTVEEFEIDAANCGADLHDLLRQLLDNDLIKIVET